MRALFSPVLIVLVLAGFSLSYGSQDTPINLKQLVQNQIAQIKARAIKQESAPLENKASGSGQPAVNQTELNQTPVNQTSAVQTQVNQTSVNQTEAAPRSGKTEKVYPKPVKNQAGSLDNGLFLKIFILLDLSLLAGLIVYWRRRKLKVGKAEKAKFKKNVTKLRSEAKFRRHPEVKKDEVRKNLQLDPVCDTADEALLRKHARKLSVPSGELMLASRLRSLEKAHE